MSARKAQPCTCPAPPRSPPCFCSTRGKSVPQAALNRPPPTVFFCAAVNTNGCITQDVGAGEVIQLQGDQRQNAREWLLAQEVVPTQDAERIVIHGY